MTNKIRNQALRIGLLCLALAAMVIGMALPVAAAGPTGPVRPPVLPTNLLHTLQGKVVSVAATSFVIQTDNRSDNQTLITVNVDNSTRYFLINNGKFQNPVDNKDAKDNKQDKKAPILPQRPQPPSLQQKPPVPNNQLRETDPKALHIPENWRGDLGWLQNFDKKAKFSDIAIGDRVIVRADNTKLAKEVLIIKAPVNRTITGTITLTDPTHITIQPKVGNAIQLNVVAATHINLVGQTAISGYAVALYNSQNNNALVVTVQAKPPVTTPRKPELDSHK